MSTSHDLRFSLALAVLVAAPATADLRSAAVLSGLWAIQLGLSALTDCALKRLLQIPQAVLLGRVIVCTSAAAAILLLAPLVAPLPLAWPASAVLLALVAATVPGVAWAHWTPMLGLTTGVLLMVGIARLGFPPMAPLASAALAMGLLSALLALRPHALQNPAATSDAHER